MMNRIEKEVKNLCFTSAYPNNKPCKVISVGHVSIISKRTGVIGKTIETVALENNIIPERYLRNMHTYTIKDQIRLLDANITVVGLGGLGGMVVEILSRAGIGTLTLIDGDVFEDHNLNRQLMSRPDLLGTRKTVAAQKRVYQVNPSIKVIAVDSFITKSNSEQLIRGSHLVVDCLDNIKTRFILENAAKSIGIPMVSAAVAGLSGQVTTIFPEDTGLEMIYGPPGLIKTDKGIETDLGCPPHTVSVLASLESAAVLDLVLTRKSNLKNKLLIVDLTDFTVETLNLI